MPGTLPRLPESFPDLSSYISQDTLLGSHPSFNAQALKVRHIYDKVLNLLVDTLNPLHNVQWSPKAWRLFLGPWLYKYIYIVVSRWDSINHLHKKYPSACFHISTNPLGPLLLTGHTLDELSAKSKTHSWNSLLYDQIALFRSGQLNISLMKSEYIKYSFCQHSVDPNSELINHVLPNLNPNPLLPERRTLAISLNVSRKDLAAIIFNPSFRVIDSIECGSLKPAFATLPVSILRHLYPDGNTDSVEAFILYTLSIAPPPFIRIHHSCFDSILASKRLNIIPFKIITSTGLFGSELTRYFLARSSHYGSRLYGIQHGSHYFTSCFNGFEQHEHACLDFYFTWDRYSRPDISSSQIQPPFKDIQNKDSTSNIALIVGDCFLLSPYTTQHHSRAQSCATYARMSDQLSGLLNSLSLNLNQYQLLYRKHPNTVLPKPLIEALGKRLLQLSKTKTLRLDLSKSSLVIHTYLGTPFYESMLADVPTCCLYDSVLDPPSKAFEVMLDCLHKASVLFYEPQDLAVHFSMLDLQSWWNSSIVRAARARFISDWCGGTSGVPYSRTLIMVHGDVHNYVSKL